MMSRSLAAATLAIALASAGACGGSSSMKTTAAPTAPAPTAPVAPSDTAEPWGAEVPSPEGEEAARAVLERLAAGTIAEADDVITLGAPLWQHVVKDPELADGIPIFTRMPIGDDRVVAAEGRAFSKAHGLDRAAKSVTFTSLGKNFAKGSFRPATAEERKIWYATIGFEIDGMPITIVELDSIQLLVHVHVAEGGRSIYLDDLDAWRGIFGAQ